MRGAWVGGYTPCTAATHQEWLNDVTQWRTERRIRIGYNDARYDAAIAVDPIQFMQPQMMIQDRYFYDPVAGKYTVDRYLDDLIAMAGSMPCSSGIPILTWASMTAINTT